ncbi:hypothetical protein KY289_004634 [Solanum tuberosum]|nr:hypothetical protein KY289_004634 [Solanum tuberosum]
MGAPKQKWTPDEETALKAGVRKHGPGKWRTILKDPEFSGLLYSRSNVDLKDKWRNMSVMANGCGSREKARLTLKRMNQARKQDERSLSVSTEAKSDEEMTEARLATTSSDSPQIRGSKRSIIRLDNLIMEAISNLKEPGGSNKTTIATYIEDQYWAPTNFKRLLSAKLKYLTATGRLIKMKRKYRIAPTPVLSDRRRIPSVPLLESRQRISSRVDQDDINTLTKAQVDFELTKMRTMDGNLNDNASLRARIKELERERDELHKDIEQLCMQQSGPSYIGLPTHVPLHRIAGLEQETENLKKKLAACTRENQNLQEELSEAYHIKGQLASLHSAEVSKNIEAEKQLKFFQGCVAAAFSERDHAVMEAEKAKEKEELMSRGFHELQQRIEELHCELLEEKILTATLQSEMDGEERLDEAFKEIVHKFYEIRQQSLEDIEEDVSWEDKCGCLLHDLSEMWTFSNPEETSTLKYISALEEQVETLRKSLDNLQNKLQVGLEIENHLKKKVRALEKQKILSEEKLRAQISAFRHYHSQHKINITSLLDEGFSHIKSAVNMGEEKLKDCSMSERDINSSQVDNLKLNELERQNVRINNDEGSDLIFKRNQPSLITTIAVGNSDASNALAVALNEKVETLLLLSQQEERHLLERNVNAALQKKIEDLQRNLLQVTNEKVKALMELAGLKRDHQLLQEKVNQASRQGKSLGEIAVKRTLQEKDGRLKNLLKTSYLRRWTGIQDSDGNDADTHRDSEANNMDFARMKIENATLKESLESMEHLICAVRRHRLSLLKFKEPAASKGMENCSPESLDNIINEASQLKTALGISLPLSWSVEADSGSSSKRVEEEIDNRHSTRENMDFVSAAGFEMVELLVFVAQLLKENKCS